MDDGDFHEWIATIFIDNEANIESALAEVFNLVFK